MIMGMNQPYFMPYIGFWQLVNAVDVYSGPLVKTTLEEIIVNTF